LTVHSENKVYVMCRSTRIGWRVLFAGISLWCGIGTGPAALAQAPDTVTPAPREGWWMKLHERFLERAKKGDVDLLFLGDSITQGWNDNEIWKRYYGPRRAANFGIGGDRTQHVLWRIEHGELEGTHPRVVVLMIGTNNAGANSAEEISAGIKAIVKELHERLPESKVLLLGAFPRAYRPRDTPKNATPVPLKPDAASEKLTAVNKEISKLDDGSTITYLDIGKAFLNDEGLISPEIMPDYVHLSAKGYRKWADAMEPTLWRLLDEPRHSR
jgi:lysophospholipase L1-like esterase